MGRGAGPGKGRGHPALQPSLPGLLTDRHPVVGCGIKPHEGGLREGGRKGCCLSRQSATQCCTLSASVACIPAAASAAHMKARPPLTLLWRASSTNARCGLLEPGGKPRDRWRAGPALKPSLPTAAHLPRVSRMTVALPPSAWSAKATCSTLLGLRQGGERGGGGGEGGGRGGRGGGGGARAALVHASGRQRRSASISASAEHTSPNCSASSFKPCHFHSGLRTSRSKMNAAHQSSSKAQIAAAPEGDGGEASLAGTETRLPDLHPRLKLSEVHPHTGPLAHAPVLQGAAQGGRVSGATRRLVRQQASAWHRARCPPCARPAWPAAGGEPMNPLLEHPR